MSIDKKARIGEFITQSINDDKPYKSYIPKSLPPDPAIQIEDYNLIDKATASLGRLNGVKGTLSNADMLLEMFAKKEALLSSQIEGTKSSLSEILLKKSKKSSGKIDDEQVVSNYVSAMNHGLKKIKELPLSRRLLGEIHEKLVSGLDIAIPGEFRRSQNWIRGDKPSTAAFVPPPPNKVVECFTDFEKFLNDPNIKLPILIKVGVAHAQFEMIHPFDDGNGRVGRILITLMLCETGLLEEPWLYLSLYFKYRKKEYELLLKNLSSTGDWEAWIEFFLKGIHETSEQVFKTATKIANLCEEDEKKISSSNKPGVLKIFSYLKRNPIATIKDIETSDQIDIKTAKTVSQSLQTLKNMGIVKEETEKKVKTFYYGKYMDILEEGTKF